MPENQEQNNFPLDVDFSNLGDVHQYIYHTDHIINEISSGPVAFSLEDEESGDFDYLPRSKSDYPIHFNRNFYRYEIVNRSFTIKLRWDRLTPIKRPSVIMFNGSDLLELTPTTSTSKYKSNLDYFLKEFTFQLPSEYIKFKQKTGHVLTDIFTPDWKDYPNKRSSMTKPNETNKSLEMIKCNQLKTILLNWIEKKTNASISTILSTPEISDYILQEIANSMIQTPMKNTVDYDSFSSGNDSHFGSNYLSVAGYHFSEPSAPIGSTGLTFADIRLPMNFLSMIPEFQKDVKSSIRFTYGARLFLKAISEGNAINRNFYQNPPSLSIKILSCHCAYFQDSFNISIFGGHVSLGSADDNVAQAFLRDHQTSLISSMAQLQPVRSERKNNTDTTLSRQGRRDIKEFCQQAETGRDHLESRRGQVQKSTTFDSNNPSTQPNAPVRSSLRKTSLAKTVSSFQNFLLAIEAPNNNKEALSISFHQNHFHVSFDESCVDVRNDIAIRFQNEMPTNRIYNLNHHILWPDDLLSMNCNDTINSEQNFTTNFSTSTTFCNSQNKINSSTFRVNRFVVSTATNCGYRENNEDDYLICQDIPISDERYCSLFAVFDGHGGKECAQFLTKRFQSTLICEFQRLISSINNSSTDVPQIDQTNTTPKKSTKSVFFWKNNKTNLTPSDNTNSHEPNINIFWEGDGDIRRRDLITEHVIGSDKTSNQSNEIYLSNIQSPSSASSLHSNSSSHRFSRAFNILSSNQRNENPPSLPLQRRGQSSGFRKEHSTSLDHVSDHLSPTSIARILSLLLRNTIVKIDTSFINEQTKRDWPRFLGAVGSVVLIFGNLLLCANLGDTRVILARRKQVRTRTNLQAKKTTEKKPKKPILKGTPIVLSREHKVTTNEDEIERIEACGAFIMKGRIFGNLAVSRVFGDPDFKSCGHGPVKGDVVSVEPHVVGVMIEDCHDFLVLVSDGVADVMTSEEIVDFVYEKLNGGMEMNSKYLSNLLCRECVENRESTDNCTAIIVFLRPVT